MASWYIEKGPESDVVVSSRVRLARNFSEFPFPFKMNSNQQNEVISRVKNAVFASSKSASKEFLFLDLETISPIDKLTMVEKHVISPELAESQKRGSAIISRDEKISIMINEEDHLRIQCMFPGMQLDKAWKLCDKMDTLLEEKIEFAFDNNYGYLTCCPTNLGTGIRASAMLHLPALTMTGYIRNVLEACSKLSIAVRGLYGENSEASGNMFQVSNQVTIGMDEEEIIENVTKVTSQIMEQERTLRNELYKQNSFRFEDKIFRSLGILSNARVLTSEESLKYISDVRLGAEMGLLPDISLEILNEITIFTQPANLQKIAGKPLNPEERDVKRAEIVRGRIKT